MMIGYARTSTAEQLAGLADQVRELTAANCGLIYQEHISALVNERPELERAIARLSTGDLFIVTKLDRLARSIPDLWNLAARVQSAGAELKIINLGLDTSTATGRLMMNLIGAIAQFEREVMLERQRAGIEQARAEGKYKGRKPKARMMAGKIDELLDSGLTVQAAANILGISSRSIYRVLAGAALLALILSSPVDLPQLSSHSAFAQPVDHETEAYIDMNSVDPWTLEVTLADDSIERIAAQNQSMCELGREAMAKGWLHINGARSSRCVHVNSFEPGWNRVKP